MAPEARVMANRNRELPAQGWNTGYPAGCGRMVCSPGVRSKNRDLGSYLTPVRDRRSRLPKILFSPPLANNGFYGREFFRIAAHKQMFTRHYLGMCES